MRISRFRAAFKILVYLVVYSLSTSQPYLVRVLAHAVQLRNGILERLPGHLARLLRVPQHLFANTSEGSKSQSSELLVMHGQYGHRSTLLRSRFQAVTAQENPTVSDLHYQLSSKHDQNALLEARDTQKPS